MFLNKPIVNEESNLMLECFEFTNNILNEFYKLQMDIVQKEATGLVLNESALLLEAEMDFVGKIKNTFMQLKANISDVFDKFIMYMSNGESFTKKFLSEHKSAFISSSSSIEISGYKWSIPNYVSIRPDATFIEGGNWDTKDLSKVNTNDVNEYIRSMEDNINYDSIFSQFTNSKASIGSKNELFSELFLYYRGGEKEPSRYTTKDFNKNEIIKFLENYNSQITSLKKMKSDIMNFYNKVINYFQRLKNELASNQSITVKKLDVSNADYKDTQRINYKDSDSGVSLNRYVGCKAKEATIISTCFNNCFSILINAMKQKRNQDIQLIKRTLTNDRG